MFNLNTVKIPNFRYLKISQTEETQTETELKPNLNRTENELKPTSNRIETEPKQNRNRTETEQKLNRTETGPKPTEKEPKLKIGNKFFCTNKN